MNRSPWRQSINFLAFGAICLASFAVSNSAAARAAEPGASDTGISALADDATELQERLRELYRKIGGNPGVLSPQPKSAIVQVEEFWDANGPRYVVDRLGTQLTALQLQDSLLADPGDLEPELVARFLVTLNEIVEACKLI